MKNRNHRWHSHYPYRPGSKRGSPGTSRAAAISFEREAWTRREQAYAYISYCGAHGATCDEVAAACGWDERYSARPRLSELRTMLKIVPSGKVRRGVSGRYQTVWVVARYLAPRPIQLCLFSLNVGCDAIR